MSLDELEKVFVCVGVVCCSYFTFNIFRKAYLAIKVFVFPSYPDFSKYGKWSVITGATSGIGKAIAFELAARKQNIILLGRNSSKLRLVSKQIESKHNVQTKYLEVDFDQDESIYNDMEDFLNGIDIGVLVNNVAIRACPVRFLDVPGLSGLIQRIFRINMLSCCKMHQIILPGMVQRKRGLIINMSSAVAIAPTVDFAIYGATKAFVDYLSQTLSYEYVSEGVTIQSWVCKKIPVPWIHKLIKKDVTQLLHRMSVNNRPDMPAKIG